MKRCGVYLWMDSGCDLTHVWRVRSVICDLRWQMRLLMEMRLMHIHKLHRILRYHCAVSTAVIVRRNKIRICTCTLLIKILLMQTEPAAAQTLETIERTLPVRTV